MPTKKEPIIDVEIRRNEKSGVTACGCKEFMFSRGVKSCHHLSALEAFIKEQQ